MSKITIKTNKDKAEKIGNTTVSGGGYVEMNAKEIDKYSYPPAEGSEPGAQQSVVTAEKAAAGQGTAAGAKSGMADGAAVPGGVVAARDYVSGKGYSGIVGWDGENVMIGGFAVAPSFVKDGTAYVSKSMADYAVKQLEQSRGIRSSADIEKETDKKYGAKAEAAINALLGREAFAYDPDTDPVYAAYKSMYEREGDAAYRRVLNDNNTSAAGASGAVLAEAIAARGDYAKRITDMIPELAADAYERYSGDGERLSDNLKAITELADEYYDRQYSAGRDAHSDIISAGKAERDERQRLAKLEITREQNRINNARNAEGDIYKNALNRIAAEKGGIELSYYPRILESGLLKDRYSAESAALDNAAARGFYTAGDEALLPWLAEYRTEGGYSISPMLTQAAYAYQNEYNKKRADIAAIMGW